MRGMRWALLLPMALAACTAPRAVPTPPAPGPSCLDALARRGALFDPTLVPVAQRGCSLTEGVTLRSAGASVEPPATMSCSLALALSDFDEHVVQPAAQRHFGRPATTLRNFGAYSCRMRTGGSGRLSHHAAGLAIDIAGFEVEGGPRILVKEHWRDPGPRGRFLREIAHAACGSFSVVLTPNTDVWHRDHIHLDLGRERLCGV